MVFRGEMVMEHRWRT